jgi:hypothetical protein
MENEKMLLLGHHLLRPNTTVKALDNRPAPFSRSLQNRMQFDARRRDYRRNLGQEIAPRGWVPPRCGRPQTALREPFLQ